MTRATDASLGGRVTCITGAASGTGAMFGQALADKAAKLAFVDLEAMVVDAGRT